MNLILNDFYALTTILRLQKGLTVRCFVSFFTNNVLFLISWKRKKGFRDTSGCVSRNCLIKRFSSHHWDMFKIQPKFRLVCAYVCSHLGRCGSEGPQTPGAAHCPTHQAHKLCQSLVSTRHHQGCQISEENKHPASRLKHKQPKYKN